MTQTAPRSKKPLLIGGIALVAVAAGAVMFVLPAETGWDPTGVGKALGLVEIADPVNEEQQRGMARMERETVLELSDAAPAAQPGATDVWEYELPPFEGIEFKYTIPQGGKMAFNWQGSAPLHYDMHGHPFDGGTEMTESYGVSEAQAMQGIYTAPFTGIHGWYWQNRSLDTVTLRLEASGAMTTSTLFTSMGEVDRPLEGVENTVEGSAAGHQMQQPDSAAE
ncbi:hypothetical protein [Alteraurantiacibacter buctensis]|uniref:hypothetical protein n=1 Tax=Alteraurantiacibacter buctensis TaxID=1503981 RepID=UPI001927CCA8|nr:hypothetical protein [Alteraurantiacibacter buctensis]